MHYVYYLLGETEGDLLYVGRSVNPRARQTDFHRRTGVKTVMGVCQRFSDISQACQAELKAIKEHRPLFNKVLVSSIGSLGKPHPVSIETRCLLSKIHSGVPKSEDHRANLSRAHRGKIFTDEHKMKISQAKLSMTDETRAKIGRASIGRSWSEESKNKLRRTRMLKKQKGGTQN